MVFALVIKIFWAQPCPYPPLVFTSQSQIDSFAILYPNCTEFYSDIEISGNDITNFQGLNGLTLIGGDLLITFNSSLLELSGFENLEEIWGSLVIYGNLNLIDLTGMDSLINIYTCLRIESNHSLTDISGLNNLINSNLQCLHIRDNPVLSICNKQWLCNYLANPSGSVHIYDNAAGCNNPPEIGDSCGIQLPCLPYGYYYFRTQAEIDSFQVDYPFCSEIYGSITISGPYINNLQGLDIITSIDKELYINNIYFLTGLEGLENLSSVGLDLRLAYTSVENINSLSNLSYVGRHMSISDNFYLGNLDGLGSLDAISGWVFIINNDSLVNLVGMQNLNSIGSSLIIKENASIKDLSGINSLSSIGNDLIIENNNALSSLEALTSLNNIDGDLHIINNDGLHSLSGLDYIEAASIENLSINGNYYLSSCEVKSICDYLVSPTGAIEIYYNASGCNSEEEVKDACGIVSREELIEECSLRIYPNPSYNIFTIKLPYTTKKNTTLAIYNLICQKLITQQITEPQTVVDISGLPQGVYFVKVMIDEKLMVEKIVKK